ncbi:hypothetical protein [Nostoc sp. MG11]|uniref:hypothetical protein n=1 Tax=Nostoc sp. MG11 TaxID=2721166 RepID=UPI001D015FC6|nr:hypothetical protein [Nostoc sp. MG11]
MKSTERPSKPPKQQPKFNDQSLKLDLVAYRPAERLPSELQLNPAHTADESVSSTLTQVSAELAVTDSPNAGHNEPTLPPQAQTQAMPQAHRNDNAAAPRKKKLDSPQGTNAHLFEKSDEEKELPPQHCQHMQFLDCDKPVGRVVFECWHCKQGIVSEFGGEPAMGEYKGRPSVVLAKVQCPSCGETGIRLNAKEVLSTVAVASPWR